MSPSEEAIEEPNDCALSSSNPVVPSLEKATEFKTIGNQHFQKKEFDQSLECYIEALKYCSEEESSLKSILHSNSAAVKYHLERYDESLEDCNQALELNPDYTKALHRRAQVNHKLDKLDDSLKDYERYHELVPSDKETLRIMQELKSCIDVRNEKLKTEMLSKLKDLGNTVLRPFGLSTDNFQLVKNPETDGYSINFQGNK